MDNMEKTAHFWYSCKSAAMTEAFNKADNLPSWHGRVFAMIDGKKVEFTVQHSIKECPSMWGDEKYLGQGVFHSVLWGNERNG